MGIIDRLFGRGVTIRLQASRAPIVENMTVQELYATQPALRAVVSFLADNVAQLPLHAYIRRGDNDRVRDTASPLARLIRDPGSGFTFHELMRDSVTDYLLYGKVLWVAMPSADAASGWTLTRIPAGWLGENPTRDGMTAESYVFTNPVTSKRVELPAEDVVWFGAYGQGDPLHPSSPVEALKEVLSEQVNAWAFRNGVWKNHGRMTAYIARPKDAPAWSNDAFDRFAKSMRARYGKGGTEAGGMPVLEDGMEIREVGFNAKEAQWYEATKLSREDVAAVYHVNPALIWHTDGQTYASARDNARALYADTLAPILDMLEERMNAFLLPRMGLDPRTYVEFDLEAKLSGSFEEMAGVLQSSVGAPWMTRNEGRARLNLPAVEGGDELVVPLNVVAGGLASPNDTDPTAAHYGGSPRRKAARPALVKAHPDDSQAAEVREVLERFLERQGKSVLNAIKRAGPGSKEDGEWPAWWQAARWDRELAADLLPVLRRLCAAQGAAAIGALLGDADAFDADACDAYLAAMAEGKAKAMNDVTYRQLEAALSGDATEGTEGATPEGVFEKTAQRAESAGHAYASAVLAWSSIEAVRQAGGEAPGEKVKTWVTTSANPRPGHAAMDGETVPVFDTFSNGARFPGDQALSPDESCNCQCEIEISVR